MAVLICRACGATCLPYALHFCVRADLAPLPEPSDLARAVARWLEVPEEDRRRVLLLLDEDRGLAAAMRRAADLLRAAGGRA